MTDRTDYFTRAQFADFAEPSVFDYDDVDRAQAVVVDMLEKWAGSAWPNVAVEVGNGNLPIADATLTLTSGTWPSDVAGRQVVVPGADTGGEDLVTTIASRTSDTVVELDDPALVGVTGATIRWGDGDGTALAARSRITWADGSEFSVGLTGWPTIDVLDLSTVVDSVEEAVDADDFTLYPERGRIVFGLPLGTGRRTVRITESFGFTETPPAIRNAVMHAAKSYLEAEKGQGAGIPANVVSYTTEGAVLNFDRGDEQPWPWDRAASEQVRAYWEGWKAAVAV